MTIDDIKTRICEYLLFRRQKVNATPISVEMLSDMMQNMDDNEVITVLLVHPEGEQDGWIFFERKKGISA